MPARVMPVGEVMILQCSWCDKPFDSDDWEWEEGMPPEQGESYWCGHCSTSLLNPCEP